MAPGEWDLSHIKVRNCKDIIALPWKDTGENDAWKFWLAKPKSGRFVLELPPGSSFCHSNLRFFSWFIEQSCCLWMMWLLCFLNQNGEKAAWVFTPLVYHANTKQSPVLNRGGLQVKHETEEQLKLVYWLYFRSSGHCVLHSSLMGTWGCIWPREKSWLHPYCTKKLKTSGKVASCFSCAWSSTEAWDPFYFN